MKPYICLKYFKSRVKNSWLVLLATFQMSCQDCLPFEILSLPLSSSTHSAKATATPSTDGAEEVEEGRWRETSGAPYLDTPHTLENVEVQNAASVLKTCSSPIPLSENTH